MVCCVIESFNKDKRMNVKSYLRGVGVLLAVVMFIRFTYATLPENYLNNWDDPVIA
jgi:hypothetical protein